MSTAPRNKDRDRDRDRELSEILLEAQLLRAEVVQRALADAKKLGEPLWRLLLREGLLTDDQLFRVLKQYVRVPVLAEEHLENVVVPPELREALKPRLAQLLGVLPLERSTDGRRAALAMVDPTIDIAPLWPALTPLGVVEVRRFLLNLPTLRRGMQMFYGQAYESQAVDVDLDGPTPPPSRSAITQPIPRPVSEAPSVMVDPGLQAEIEQLSGAMPIPALSDDNTGPIEAPAPAAPSRPLIPSALLTTMPSVRSEPLVPSRRSGGEPVGAAPSRGGSRPGESSGSAIPIEIDLPDLLQSSSGENTPLRELPGQRGQASRSSAVAPVALEGPRSPQALGRSGPVAAPAPSAVSAPPEGARAAAPRRSPTAPPLPPAESTRTTAPIPGRSTTIPPVLPAAAMPSATSVPPVESTRTTAPIPKRSNTIPPVPATAAPSASSVPSRPGAGGQALPAPAPSQLGRVTAPTLTERPQRTAPSAQSPMQELTAADMVMEDDRAGLKLDRSALRVPATQSDAQPEVAQDAVQDALIATCEALVSTVESQLRTTWPTTLARLCQGVGDQLGFAPRAVRELMLVARLRGVVRAELLSRGPLPPPRPTLLGYPTSSPLLGAARELQKVLVDFMRLPQDDDEPLGMRIVATAAQALELRDKGLGDDELVTKLREQLGDTDVVFQVHKALTLNPPPSETSEAELAPVPAAALAAAPVAPTTTSASPTRQPALWPLPPRMPTVPWNTWRVAELSAEGFLPYLPDEA